MESAATSHLFEIPWNGDEGLLKSLSESEYKDKVAFVYVPCATEDGLCTRTGGEAPVYNREGLFEVVQMIKRYGFEPCILFQRDANPSSIPFYVDVLKVKNFTVADDPFALEIRSKCKGAFIVASITKDLLPEDYEWYSQNAPDLYDTFVLRYAFSRDVDSLKALPKNLSYTIMPNNTCLWNCMRYREDWFPGKSEAYESVLASLPKDLDCQSIRQNADGRVVLNRVMFIEAQDLWFFDGLVDGYKLVDRMDTTQCIMSHFNAYAGVSVEPVEERAEHLLEKYNLAKGRQVRTGPPIMGFDEKPIEKQRPKFSPKIQAPSTVRCSRCGSNLLDSVSGHMVVCRACGEKYLLVPTRATISFNEEDDLCELAFSERAIGYYKSFECTSTE